MVPQDSLLVTLVKRVDRLPMPAIPSKRERGHPTAAFVKCCYNKSELKFI